MRVRRLGAANIGSANRLMPDAGRQTGKQAYKQARDRRSALFRLERLGGHGFHETALTPTEDPVKCV